MTLNYDYIIVGHGLAGSILSQLLLERNKKILVFDQPDQNRSSKVAAGLYNPVTGRKMVKTWMADELFPFIEKFYSELERSLKREFLYPIGIYRPFVDTAELNDWYSKSTDNRFKPYIEAVANGPCRDFLLNDPHGGLHLNMSGYVDIPAMLDASRERLMAGGCYRQEHFNEADLSHFTDHVSYGEVTANSIIFCNGLDAKSSKFFNWLPFKPVKGEVLLLRTNKKANKIYNRGVFFLPRHDGQIRAGSTYKNHFDHLEPTMEGRQELNDKLNQLVQEKFQIIDVVAGARPATKDRKPFIGKHFEYEHIYVFNGFGSKGVSLVPYFAQQFVEYLEGNSTLNNEVNIDRYYPQQS